MGFSKSKFKIFISSHTESLIKEREEVEQILRNIGFKNIFRAEKIGSKNASPYVVCMNKVKECDLFILLLGSIYSSKPLNKTSLSPTEKEYNLAKEEDKVWLVFKLKCPSYEPRQLKFIQRVENFKNGRSRGASIGQLEDLKRRIHDDVNNYIIEKKAADKKVPLGRLMKSEEAIEFEKKSIVLLDKIDPTDAPLLQIKARINYTHEAGSAQIVNFSFNNYTFTLADLINKPAKLVSADLRQFDWYNPQTKSWSLLYSKNFKDNYENSKYKITNGDPFTFIFSLNNAKLNATNNKLIITHAGTKENEAFKNAIVISDCSFIL